MKPKERMLAVLNGEEPDQVPTGEIGVDYPITEYVLGHPTYYRAKYHEKSAVWAGKRDEVVVSQKRDLVSLAQKLEWDFIPVFLTYSTHQNYAPSEFIDETTWKDVFGRTWKYSTVTEDILCVDMPRLDEQAIEILREPFTVDESELELVRHVVETLGDSHFIVGRTSIELRDATPVIGRGPVDGTFPEPYGGLMMDTVDFSLLLMDDPNFVKRLLSASTDRGIEVALALVDAGVHAIVMDTDYCHQTGPWASPDHFREIVIPLLKKQVDAIHSAGAYVIKHTDGNTWPILDMVVSAGIDGLHGIQPSAGMDLTTLKEKYGSKVALFGAVEGEILINSQPNEIRELVRRQIMSAGEGGGYVLTSGNSVQLGVPPENYLTMLEALRAYGRYPLSREV
ncbi:MAG: uroporphyrinogen decarboxylase family protein [Chloroflexota bacterium]